MVESAILVENERNVSIVICWVANEWTPMTWLAGGIRSVPAGRIRVVSISSPVEYFISLLHLAVSVDFIN